MGINIADNFAYNGKKPMDNRTEYTTLAAMKAVVDANINEGCMCYNKEDGKYYTFKSTNTVDATTGKWREFETGGGGQTYNDFTGATASTAGAHGLVPAPSAGDEGKVLFGNGAWGNIVMPSVDLSVLSNEAFIFSATEKVVGQWIDGKLLYQKTVTGYAGASDSVSSTLDTISDIDEMICAYGVIDCGTNDKRTAPNLSSSIEKQGANITFYTNSNQIFNKPLIVTFQYTKTTDSPLPAGVKFAGVTSDGKVILEQTLDFGQNVEIPTTSWYTTNLSNSNIGTMRGAYGVSSTGTLWNLNANCDSGNYVQLQVCRHDSGTSSVRWATVKYTLAS